MVEHIRRARGFSRFARVLCLLLCVAALLSVFAAEDSRVIRVGAFPYDSQLKIDQEGNYSGYGFDYLQEIARYTGWQYEFVDATWEESLTMLAEGELDLMGAVMKNPAREQTLDFSDWAMISGYGVLATPLDNAKLPYEDFAAFDRLRVGAMRSNQQTASFLAYSTEHSFTPQMFYYETQEALVSALDRGDLDAILLTSVLRSDHLRVVAKFGENDSYFATTKGNTEVLNRVNSAMGQIRYNNPYFNSELDQKYFDFQTATPISYTHTELDFVQNSGPIRCLYNPAARPISYTDARTGKAQGIAVDVCSLLEEKTGLTLELIPAPTAEEALDLLSRGEADMLLAQAHDYSWAQRNHALLTDAYLEGQIVMVYQDQIPISPVSAICEQSLPEATVKFVTGTAAQVLYYGSTEECLNAVRTGQADVTYVNSIVMSYQNSNPKFTQLQTAPMYGYSMDTCIAVSAAVNPTLLLILDKALTNISDAQINHIVSSNLKPDQRNTLGDLLYARPLESILLISSVLLVVAFVLFLLFWSRAKNARLMKRMVYIDALTGGPTYKALTEGAPALLGHQPERYALLYMDMHQFKAINDAFGYDAGDRVLKEIAALLHDFVAENERYARVYADKFVLLIHCVPDDQFRARISDLSTRLGGLSMGEFHGANFLFTGGVYRMQRGSCDMDMAFDRANYAKSTVKAHFVNTFVFYDDVMRSQVLMEKSLESRMLPALARGEFVPFYQPKVNVITGEVVGVEALVRWLQMDGSYLPPDEFLPFYEKNGFIVRIDFTMFETVCQHLHHWLEIGNEPVTVSVNFSRHHIQDVHFAEKLMEITQRYGVPTSILEIEITETIALDSIVSAVDFVRALKDKGFSISIDDYGSGYSSISFLQDLPLDVLKLDKEFIVSAMQSSKGRDLMRYLVTALKNNGIRVICEGIETQEQRDFIVSLNCRYAQGFLYAKPMPRKEFEDYLLQHSIAELDDIDFVSIDSIGDQVWSSAGNFLNSVMPGWIVGCYTTKGYPVFYISPAFLASLGYSEPEFLHATGGLYLNCLHPDDVEQVVDAVKGGGQGFEAFRMEYRLMRKDGTILWIRDIGKTVLTDEGRESLLRVCTDITDIVEARQDAETVRAQLDLALTLTEHAVFEYDLATSALCGQTGLAAYFPQNLPMERVPDSMMVEGRVHPEDMGAFRDMFRLLAQGAPYASCEVRLRGVKPPEDNAYLWTDTVLSAITGEDGVPIRAVGVLERIDRPT